MEITPIYAQILYHVRNEEVFPRKQLAKTELVEHYQLALHTLPRIIIVTQLLVGYNPLLQTINASLPDAVYFQRSTRSYH